MPIYPPKNISLPRLIALIGPTASGKSQLALSLAKIFNGEIIAADSRTLYRGMDIGTAKPERDLEGVSLSCGCSFSSQGIIHHLIDRLDPSDLSNVAIFKKMAERCLKDIMKRKKIPFLVGGTGQYSASILYPTELLSSAPNAEMRKKIEQLSLTEQYDELVKRDRGTALRIDRHNPRRVARALEIVFSTGAPRQATRPGIRLVESLILGLAPPMPIVRQRIAERIDNQIQQGLIDEVLGLVREYGWEAPGLKTIGYHEWHSWQAGEATFLESKQRLVYDTRHYAKRQLTWFKRDQTTYWLSLENSLFEARERITNFLKN